MFAAVFEFHIFIAWEPFSEPDKNRLGYQTVSISHHIPSLCGGWKSVIFFTAVELVRDF